RLRLCAVIRLCVVRWCKDKPCRIGATSELRQRAGTLQAAWQRRDRLAIRRHRTQGRPQWRAEAVARRCARGERGVTRGLEGVLSGGECFPADSSGPSRGDDGATGSDVADRADGPSAAREVLRFTER